MKQLKMAMYLAIAFAAGAASMLALTGRDKAKEPVAETHAAKKADSSRGKRIPESATSKPVRAKDVRTTSEGCPAEKPKADAVEPKSDKDAKGDNPFPRYLDMFKNDPDALAAEFLKEAEADRANHRKMRDKAIAKLKLNAEQAAVFEKALDDLKNAILQHEQEEVDLITSGQVNMDTAADGRLWDSNLLLMDQCGAAKEKIVRDAAVELYNQLAVDNVPDAEKQKIIKWTTYNTSFSFDCYEPVLQVYDKVYKNMGFGKGIFSWCVRPQQKK